MRVATRVFSRTVQFRMAPSEEQLDKVMSEELAYDWSSLYL